MHVAQQLYIHGWPPTAVFPGPGSPMKDGYASFNLKESAGRKLQTAPLLAT